MSQDFTRSRTRQTHHILIIDDSARLRQTLAELIVANCLATGKIFKVFHSDRDGKYTQSNEIPGPGMLLVEGINPVESPVIDEFTIYTAPSPKQALFVINSPVFSRLTIISDVMMPADTEVGLIGMLEAIARRNLPVNLVFASSDPQNSFVVAKLVETGKAYFLVKQGSAWEDLSKALVQRTDSFRFKTITSLDFQGMQKIAGYTMRATSHTAPLSEPERQATTTARTFGTYPLSSSAAKQAEPPNFKPLPATGQLPRVEGVSIPDKSLSPEAIRPTGQPFRPEQPRPPGLSSQPEVVRLPVQPVNPDLPPAPDPVLKAIQPPTPPLPIKAVSTVAPVIEGFMPVTPNTPHLKTDIPPMPAWDDPNTPRLFQEGVPGPGEMATRLAAQASRIPGVPVVVPEPGPEPEVIQTLPSQTQTPLAQFVDTLKPEKKKGFVLFRPFAALLNSFKKH